MSEESIILVTGATGQQGGAVARALLAGGHRVRAMTRNPEGEKAVALAALGAEVVQGDFDDPASLERALEGAWGVFGVQNTWEAGVEGEEAQGKRLAELARSAGAQHFVYTSVGSAHRSTGIPHFDNKWRIEEKVRELGFPSYTILRPVFFMDNFLSPWFKPGIDEGVLRAGIQPDTRLQMIAVEDIGRFGRLAFERPEELNGQEIDIAGDELTLPQAAEILSEVTGKKVTFEPTPIEEIRAWSEDFAIMLEWFDRVGYDVHIEGLAERFGFRPKRFAEWAKSAAWGVVV
ncbi:MAG: NmrA/HSCARG family protein [Gemmatimonadota bacterium]